MISKSAYIHLTNFTINKKYEESSNISDSESNEDGKNLNFTIIEETSSNSNTESSTKVQDECKRLITDMMKQLSSEGIDVKDWMEKIKDIIRKTILSCQPTLEENYRLLQPNSKRMDMCFEILGFDILIDKNGKPWLIEVNHSPSFETSTKLDRVVKDKLLHDTFDLLNINPKNK
jgi:tubulin polyglutamylase TTLL6/13